MSLSGIDLRHKLWESCGMGRPSLALGTYGTVRTYKTVAGYRAMTRYRDYDGTVRPVERHGTTKGAAENNLRTALRDRARVDGGSTIQPDTKVVVLAEAWYQSLTVAPRSITTMAQYRDRIDKQIIPSIGQLRVRELSPGVVDRHLAAIAGKHGNATAKMTRTVMSGICGLAVRADALDRNPVREASAISTKPQNRPRSLSVDEVRQLLAYLTYDDKAIRRDLPDLVAFIAATGLRIGEATGITWDTLDLEAGTVEVRGTVIPVRGQGPHFKPSPKTDAGARTLLLPTWCIEMLRRRAARGSASSAEARNPVFPAPRGGLRDPSNTQADLKEAFAYAGLPWATSHTLRKTVATLMDQAGLSARAAADQLGHSKTSMTQDNYYGRKIAATGAATILEALG
ncbi:MAG: site-specific integrase [Pseudonocardia sp.]